MLCSAAAGLDSFYDTPAPLPLPLLAPPVFICTFRSHQCTCHCWSLSCFSSVLQTPDMVHQGLKVRAPFKNICRCTWADGQILSLTVRNRYISGVALVCICGSFCTCVGPSDSSAVVNELQVNLLVLLLEPAVASVLDEAMQTSLSVSNRGQIVHG